MSRRKAGTKFAHTSGPSRDHPKTSQTKKFAKNAPKICTYAKKVVLLRPNSQNQVTQGSA